MEGTECAISIRKDAVIRSRVCRAASRPIVPMIDEVDSASNNRVFIDFLAQLRAYYLKRRKKPIINGTGNYYLEAQTKDASRTDVIVDYLGQQFVVELKIWRGNEYNERGERQITEYLDYYHLDKGYMLSFNFNKKKEVGVKELQVEDKMIVEAVV